MIKNKDRKELFEKMYFIREVENKIAINYPDNEMRCPVHLSTGQEAIAVGICKNLLPHDKILSAHRSHAHYLAKGGNLDSMLGELYGKYMGCVKGKGGSMHLQDLKVGMIASVPIVGSAIPIGVGVAWAKKLKKHNSIVVIFFGEAATEEGVFLESLDFASLHKLPVLFICENNFFSVYSPLYKRQSSTRKITNISRSLGINSKKIDGNDVEKIYLDSKKIIKNIKNGHGPFLLELNTFRHLEHVGPYVDDNLKYRSLQMINKWKKKCPIVNYEKTLINKKILSSKEIINFRNRINKIIDKSFLKVKKSKFPGKIELYKDIYQ
mgnify:CR=1 FL=1|tara:strand:- start:1050 stop:2018 length:969 start_codon:yes stop_codon:yes gene_type:complete